MGMKKIFCFFVIFAILMSAMPTSIFAVTSNVTNASGMDETVLGTHGDSNVFSHVKAISLTSRTVSEAPKEEWNKTFGSTGDDEAWTVQQTDDGGYVLAGDTLFETGLCSAWLLKTNSNGDMEWKQTFRGTGFDSVSSVQQTADGGYILAGDTLFETGLCTAWLLKTNSKGEKEWEQTFRGTGFDSASSVQQTSDGGYILAGNTLFETGLCSAWLVKTNSHGDMEWEKTFGITGFDSVSSVQQTTDGDYILAGDTLSSDAGLTAAWLVKTNSKGEKECEATFGGTGLDSAYSVQQTTDGGYILAGETLSFYTGLCTAWLVKTNAKGIKEWEKTYGETGLDSAYAVQQTIDGGYIFAGETFSLGAYGWTDAWLVKTDSEGNEKWERTFGGSGDDSASAVQLTADGGYVIAGCTDSYGAGDYDAWLIKVKGTTGLTEIADLTLSQEDIYFKLDPPTLGEPNTIYTTIHNNGNADARNVIVQFFDGDPDDGGTQIGNDQTIASITAGGTGTAQVDWIATSGSHDIYVIVDSYEDIPELDGSNNEAHRAVNVNVPGVFKASYSADFDVPIATFPGDTKTIPVTITNTGDRIWHKGEFEGENPKEGTVFLGYHIWFKEHKNAEVYNTIIWDDGNLTPLPKDISPGESCVVNLEVTTPNLPLDKYELFIDAVAIYDIYDSYDDGIPSSSYDLDYDASLLWFSSESKMTEKSIMLQIPMFVDGEPLEPDYESIFKSYRGQVVWDLLINAGESKWVYFDVQNVGHIHFDFKSWYDVRFPKSFFRIYGPDGTEYDRERSPWDELHLSTRASSYLDKDELLHETANSILDIEDPDKGKWRIYIKSSGSTRSTGVTVTVRLTPTVKATSPLVAYIQPIETINVVLYQKYVPVEWHGAMIVWCNQKPVVNNPSSDYYVAIAPDYIIDEGYRKDYRGNFDEHYMKIDTAGIAFGIDPDHAQFKNCGIVNVLKARELDANSANSIGEMTTISSFKVDPVTAAIGATALKIYLASNFWGTLAWKAFEWGIGQLLDDNPERIDYSDNQEFEWGEYIYPDRFNCGRVLMLQGCLIFTNPEPTTFLSFVELTPYSGRDVGGILVEHDPLHFKIAVPVTPIATMGETFTNTIGMEFVQIPAGEFDMGSPLDEAGRESDEGPVHHVTIEDPFYIGGKGQ